MDRSMDKSNQPPDLNFGGKHSNARPASRLPLTTLLARAAKLDLDVNTTTWRGFTATESPAKLAMVSQDPADLA